MKLSGALSAKLIPADQPQELIAKLVLEGGTLQPKARPPINLVLLLDTSCSMKGAPIAAARRAAEGMIGKLNPADRLSLITFHAKAEVLIPSIRMGDLEREDLERGLSGIRATGTTAMRQGLTAALTQATRGRSAQSLNRIVLLSDGVPNHSGGFQQLAASAAKKGIAISALGLGLDYDETVLAQIAKTSGGDFRFIEDATRIADVFEREILQLERAVAQAPQLMLQPGPGVKLLEIIGHPTRTSIRLPDLSEGDTKTLFVRLKVPARAAERTIELLDARLRFVDPVRRAGTLERHHFWSTTTSSSAEAVQASVDEAVINAALRAQAAAQTLSAIEALRSGSAASADRLLEQAAHTAQNNAHPKASSQATRIRALRRAVPKLHRKAQNKDEDRALRSSHNEAWRTLY